MAGTGLGHLHPRGQQQKAAGQAKVVEMILPEGKGQWGHEGPLNA